MNDKWKELRKDLWGNVEPSVSLIGISVPVATIMDRYVAICPDITSDSIELQVSEAAATSTGVEFKNAQKLIRTLIEKGHHTPLEAVQYNFYISGISKACGAQMSRHRIGQGHVSSSRRYQQQQVSFVYPLLEDIDSESDAQSIYSSMSDSFKASYYQYLTFKRMGAKKGDCRYVIPTASASERSWWINARALRDFFSLRLEKTAESEIRRLSYMILDCVVKITPTLFEDIRGGTNVND